MDATCPPSPGSHVAQNERSVILKRSFARKVWELRFLCLGTFSAYLCVLCVKYIGANVLTQSTQRYTEIRRKTRTANEPTFRAKPLDFVLKVEGKQVTPSFFERVYEL